MELSEKKKVGSNVESVVDPSKPNNVAPPTFTSDTKLSPERYIARVGDKFSVFCQARGHPEPTISWFKDSKPIDDLVYSKG